MTFITTASTPTVGSIEFFAEVAMNDVFSPGTQVTLPAEGVGINFSGDFSYEIWIAPSATAGDNPDSTTAGANNNWINSNIFLDRDLRDSLPAHGIGLSAGLPCFGVSTSGSERTIIASTTDTRDGNMHFVVFNRTQSSGAMTIDVDGSEEASGTGPTGDVDMPDAHTPLTTCGFSGTADCVNSDPCLVLGREKHKLAANGYVGLVSQFRISNITRAATVPTSAMTSDGNTLALYNFGEQTGTTIADSSGNGHTMTIVADANGPGWDVSTPY